jgi:biopolymer transport protein ExbD
MSDMNLTSMMDCVWLLLITFIIAYPMIENSIAVNLPAAKAAPATPQAKAVTVTIDKEGRLFLADITVTEDMLQFQLAEEKARNPELSVQIRGDATVNYGKVVDVLKILHQLGITKMASVTREE